MAESTGQPRGARKRWEASPGVGYTAQTKTPAPIPRYAAHTAASVAKIRGAGVGSAGRTPIICQCHKSEPRRRPTPCGAPSCKNRPGTAQRITPGVTSGITPGITPGSTTGVIRRPVPRKAPTPSSVSTSRTPRSRYSVTTQRTRGRQLTSAVTSRGQPAPAVTSQKKWRVGGTPCDCATQPSLEGQSPAPAPRTTRITWQLPPCSPTPAPPCQRKLPSADIPKRRLQGSAEPKIAPTSEGSIAARVQKRRWSVSGRVLPGTRPVSQVCRTVQPPKTPRQHWFAADGGAARKPPMIEYATQQGEEEEEIPVEEEDGSVEVYGAKPTWGGEPLPFPGGQEAICPAVKRSKTARRSRPVATPRRGPSKRSKLQPSLEGSSVAKVAKSRWAVSGLPSRPIPCQIASPPKAPRKGWGMEASMVRLGLAKPSTPKYAIEGEELAEGISTPKSHRRGWGTDVAMVRLGFTKPSTPEYAIQQGEEPEEELGEEEQELVEVYGPRPTWDEGPLAYPSDEEGAGAEEQDVVEVYGPRPTWDEGPLPFPSEEDAVHLSAMAPCAAMAQPVLARPPSPQYAIEEEGVGEEEVLPEATEEDVVIVCGPKPTWGDEPLPFPDEQEAATPRIEEYGAIYSEAPVSVIRAPGSPMYAIQEEEEQVVTPVCRPRRTWHGTREQIYQGSAALPSPVYATEEVAGDYDVGPEGEAEGAIEVFDPEWRVAIKTPFSVFREPYTPPQGTPRTMSPKSLQIRQGSATRPPTPVCVVEEVEGGYAIAPEEEVAAMAEIMDFEWAETTKTSPQAGESAGGVVDADWHGTPKPPYRALNETFNITPTGRPRSISSPQICTELAQPSYTVEEPDDAGICAAAIEGTEVLAPGWNDTMTLDQAADVSQEEAEGAVMVMDSGLGENISHLSVRKVTHTGTVRRRPWGREPTAAPCERPVGGRLRRKWSSRTPTSAALAPYGASSGAEIVPAIAPYAEPPPEEAPSRRTWRRGAAAAPCERPAGGKLRRKLSFKARSPPPTPTVTSTPQGKPASRLLPMSGTGTAKTPGSGVVERQRRRFWARPSTTPVPPVPAPLEQPICQVGAPVPPEPAEVENEEAIIDDLLSYNFPEPPIDENEDQMIEELLQFNYPPDHPLGKKEPPKEPGQIISGQLEPAVVDNEDEMVAGLLNYTCKPSLATVPEAVALDELSESAEDRIIEDLLSFKQEFPAPGSRRWRELAEQEQRSAQGRLRGQSAGRSDVPYSLHSASTQEATSYMTPQNVSNVPSQGMDYPGGTSFDVPRAAFVRSSVMDASPKAGFMTRVPETPSPLPYLGQSPQYRSTSPGLRSASGGSPVRYQHRVMFEPHLPPLPNTPTGRGYDVAYESSYAAGYEQKAGALDATKKTYNAGAASMYANMDPIQRSIIKEAQEMVGECDEETCENADIQTYAVTPLQSQSSISSCDPSCEATTNMVTLQRDIAKREREERKQLHRDLKKWQKQRRNLLLNPTGEYPQESDGFDRENAY